MKSWRSQIANGRVFELRSKSERYPAPCALVINDKANGWNDRVFVPVDRFGVIGGPYPRRHNPNIYVSGLRPEQFTSSRVVRRRRDLERFDADDLALIRSGLSLDFNGRIRGIYSDIHIPMAALADWTVFWYPAWEEDDFRWVDRTPELDTLLQGAWHFESHGGSRHLGYRFGCAWGTRHSGKRLNQIRQLLRRRWGSRLVEQSVKVTRWSDGNNVYTEEVRRDCPALGLRTLLSHTPTGHLFGTCR
jgi:hypothetical protein